MIKFGSINGILDNFQDLLNIRKREQLQNYLSNIKAKELKDKMKEDDILCELESLSGKVEGKDVDLRKTGSF